MEKDSYEIFALELLKKVYKIENLQPSESPDWKNEQTGVEVTTTIQNQDFLGYILKNLPKTIEKIKKNDNKEKTIQKFNKGYEKRGGLIIHEEQNVLGLTGGFPLLKELVQGRYIYLLPVYEDNSVQDINEALRKKIEKLNKVHNGKYLYNENVEDYRLFIFSEVMLEKSAIDKEICLIKEIQESYKRRYNIIYLYLIRTNTLITFDLNTDTVRIKENI